MSAIENDSVGISRVLTVPQIKRRAALAILIPAAIALLYATMLLHAANAWIGSFRRLLLLYLAIAIVELHCLPSLHALFHGGFSTAKAHSALNDPARIRCRRKWRFRGTAVILSLLFALIVLEIAFRMFQVRSPPPQSPRIDAELVDNKLNSLGLREPWDSLSDDDRRLRIAFLGDSFTYGQAVEQSECFCHLVGIMLQNALPQGVVTINLGVPATGPKEQHDFYQRVAPVLRPQIVIQVIYLNDLGIASGPALERIYRIRDDKLLVPYSYVLSFIEKQIRYKIAWNRTIDYFRGGGDAIQRDLSWQEFTRQVRRCKEAVDESGAFYVMVLFPWLARLDDYLLDDVHEKIRGLAAELHVPYFDLLETFRGRDDATLRISPANEHPNQLGHRLAAESLNRFFREEVIPTLGPN